MKRTYNATIVDDTSAAPAFHNSRDLTRKIFGRLLVTGFAGRGSNKLLIWNCLCSCGTKCTSYGHVLKNGAKRSCGCLGSEVTSKRSKTHGMTNSPTYKSWRSMIRRCEAPGDISYPRYGGRGISVCTRWRDSFQAFLDDMGERPSKSYQLDRIDNGGNYEKDNCRWATRKEQARNRRTTVILTFNCESLCVSEWAERMGVERGRLQNRIDLGWPVERILTEPVRRYKRRKK